MTAPAFTPWFPAQVAPTRAGVYRRRWPGGPFACWDGVRWRADAATPEAAAASVGASAFPEAAWQGLRAAPAAPCLTCRGHTVVDRGVDEETGEDLIGECPDC